MPLAHRRLYGWTGTEWVEVAVDDDGHIVTDGTYKISDIESGAYYGFIDSDGNWKIMKEDSGTYRYAFGTSDYSTNWTNRAALTYTYLDGST